jgi:hypothetical protein
LHCRTTRLWRGRCRSTFWVRRWWVGYVDAVGRR